MNEEPPHENSVNKIIIIIIIIIIIKGCVPGKLRCCEDGLPTWFDHLEESLFL